MSTIALTMAGIYGVENKKVKNMVILEILKKYLAKISLDHGGIEEGGGVGYAGCWPKKKAGQNGPSKNGQKSWPTGQKIRLLLKKKGQQVLLASHFFLLAFFL